MALSVPTDPPVLQKFKTEDGSPLPRLRSRLCAETDKRYLLWTDIQHAIQDLSHLETEKKTRILFTTDVNGELCDILLE